MLRYWETEFGFLSPRKNEGNHRLYTQKDLQKVLTIKKLLYEERYTIAGAKRRFREEWKKAQEPGVAETRRRVLRNLRKEVEGLLEILEKT